MHTHRLYHGAVRAANVVLKERTHTDPSAKLSMFSECRFAEETSSRFKLAKQDKLDYNVFFLAVVFSDRSAQTHGFGTNHASKTKSEHQEAAAEIFSSLIRSPFQDAAIFCELAEKLLALDAEIRRACDGLEHLFISGDRDPDQVIRLPEDRTSHTSVSSNFQGTGQAEVDSGEERNKIRWSM